MMNSNWISGWFNNSKLSTRFSIISIMFLSVLLGMSIYTMTTLQKDKSNALVIDIAGRQRMLFQRHANEVFLSSHGIPADYALTRELLLSTLNALKVGGSVTLDPDTGQRQSIPPARTKELSIKLQEQQDRTKRIFQLADQFLVLSPDHPEFLEQLSTLRTQHFLAIRAADEAVKQLGNYSEAAITTMVKWEVIIAIIVGWLGVFVTIKGVQDGRKLEKEVEERNRVESALRDSEAFLNSIVENIPDMIFVKNAKDLCFVRINEAGVKLIGYPRDALIGKSDFEFFPRSEAEFYTTKDREVLAGKTLLDIPEEVIRTKSQGTRYIHTKKIPILDDHGNPEYLLGISQDITEQKLEKLKHTKQELLLRLIFETGPSCIKRVAADGTLLHMNPAGLDLIEAKEENEVLGLSVFDLVVPEHLNAFRKMHQNVLKGEAQTLQFEVQGLNGTRRWMETYAVPFRNPTTNEVEQLAVTHDITERKTTEERTKQLSIQNELILLSAGDGIYGLNLQGQATFINPAGAKMLGYTPQELIGHFMHSLIHHTKPDGSSYPQEECPMYAAFTDGAIHKVNDEILWRKDGTCLPVEYSSMPILKDGNLAGAVVTFRDVTQRKQAEKTLIDTEQMYRQVLDSIPDMVLVKDRNFRIVWANKAFRSYYNMTNEELKGILDSSFNDPKFTKQYNEADSYVFKAGKVLDIPEEPVTRHDGQIALFHTIKAPLFDESREVVKSVGVSRDITERKLTEEIIRKGERKFRAIYEQAPTGIAVLDSLSGQFTQLNQKYCEITGYSQEEMLKQSFQNITHPDDLQADLDYMQQLLAGRISTFQMEKRYIRKDGQIIWVNLTCVPLWLEPTDHRQHIAMVQDITHRKQGEKALQESEERFRTLYEDNPSMYFTVTQDGTIISVNHFGAQQLGYSVDELVGQPVIDLFLEDDKPHVEQHFESCLRKPLTVNSWEYRKVRKDGSVVCVKETARAVYRNDNEIVVLIVCEDISDRKESEKKLQEWKTLTESVLGQLPKGFAYRCLNNKNWTAIYVSDGIEEVTGFPASALLSGRINYDSLVAPGENEQVWDTVQEALSKRLPYENEHRIISSDGKTKWILARGRFIFDDAGQLLYLDGLNVDITEQKQIENALRTSESRFRSLIEHLPFCIHEIGLDGTIHSMNKSGQAMLGIESEPQVIGNSYLSLAEEKDYGRIRNYFEKALEGQIVAFEFEVTIQHTVQIFMKSFIPIRRRNGSILKIIGILEDITERKMAEQRLRESEIKRTEALRQSDELKSALLSSVSHELRTPLTAIKGSISSILEETYCKLDQEQQACLQGIDKEINYLSQLVNNLLDMSQIEAGTLIPHKEWHLLEDLVEGALRHSQQSLETRDLQIQIPDDSPLAFVDAVEMQQVLINLLDNALKYSPPGSPIRLRVRIDAQQIEVTVSNKGEQIQTQDLNRIFERFYRRRVPQEEPIRGTGLGLAICKGIIEAHGGRIWAESAKKEVTVAFTIPVTESMVDFSLEGLHKR